MHAGERHPAVTVGVAHVRDATSEVDGGIRSGSDSIRAINHAGNISQRFERHVDLETWDIFRKDSGFRSPQPADLFGGVQLKLARR